MNVTNFISLLHKGEATLSTTQLQELEDVLEEYPYFQAARAIHLKNLKEQDSHKYNNALKRTAAQTADRNVLFNYISPIGVEQASSYPNPSIETEDGAQPVAADETITDTKKVLLLDANPEAPLPQTIEDAEQILDPALFESKSDAREDTSIAPAAATLANDEKHSFAEWLSLASKKETEPQKIGTPSSEKEKKFALLDKFIENNPKIVPRPAGSEQKIDIKKSLKVNQKELMTETLAKVYVEQKKYKKALQAYKILGLKYPEKSSFFADRILAVKQLQKDSD